MKSEVVTVPFGITERREARLLYGDDVRASLRTLPDASVHMACTSPPYFGLRSYAPHLVKDEAGNVLRLDEPNDTDLPPAEIGLESSPDEFVKELVSVFHDVKRVLRPDGTLWVNLGDSYVGGGGFSPDSPSNQDGNSKSSQNRGVIANPNRKLDGLKPKDLIGIPWRFALAMQADGWYLRQDIIWSKGTCMPESVTDRCTKSHEYVFLFAHPDSGGQYFFDAEAIREPAQQAGRTRKDRVGGNKHGAETTKHSDGSIFEGSDTRNKRSVWQVNSKPYKGSHFATWPPELVEPMILASTSAHGVCGACGTPPQRVQLAPCPACGHMRAPRTKTCPSCHTELDWKAGRVDPTTEDGSAYLSTDFATAGKHVPRKEGSMGNKKTQVQYVPGCDCQADIVPAVVLDPFSGSATTGMVATRLGRNYVGIDLNEDYLPLARNRVLDLPPPDTTKEPEEETLFDFFG